MLEADSSTPCVYQHEKEYDPTNDRQNIDQRINEAKTIRFGVEENEIITSNDWNRRWEMTHAPGRWQLAGIHPFLLKYAHLFRDWENRAEKSILVPLCGKSNDLLWLVQEAGLKRVVGIEGSSFAITSLLKEYTYVQVNEKIGCYTGFDGKLSIFCADFFDDNVNSDLFGETIDYIWDRAALVALHWNDHERYIQKLLSFLTIPKIEQNDTFDIFMSEYWHSQHRGPPFDVDLKHVCDIFGTDINVQQVDEIDAFYSGWQNAGFTDMSERLYGIQLLETDQQWSARSHGTAQET